ncbi:M56 family metallopeptidase [Sphingobacterium sp. WM]|uniref:M56 family metallopeptidase n=1 Tax=Sphingobacterium sp. WM TaxID=3031802 RepID=UPI00240E8DFB|nr:M56 family metallopeptidase [Sphingobacterium sp. WM]WFB63381.1 M56 family metallopeptidase [Sphingobacterium sp. WM]
MENLTFNIGNALGWSILHSIWQAAIWYIIYSIYTLSISNISAKARHNAALATQVSIFISFIATFIYFFQNSSQFIDLRTLNPEDLKNIMVNIQQDGIRLERVLPYVVAGYVFGFIVQIILLSNSLIQLKRLKYKGLDSIPASWTNLYYQAKKKLNIRQSVGIYLSNKISVPITLGYLKPFILFPVAHANKMDLAQVEAILLHELAHVKRRDYLFNLLKVGIETVLFFNPFIWALSKVLEREREHACDDMVIEHVSTPISYAQALVELEELRMSMNPSLTLAASGNKNHLLNRIKRITKMETNYKNVRPQLLAVLLSGLAILTLAWIIPSNEVKPQEIKVDLTSTEDSMLLSIDTVKPPIPETAQKPVAPKKVKSEIVYHGKGIQDTNELPLDVRNSIRSLEERGKKIQEYHNSPEWNAQIKNIEEQSKKVSAYFESPEWKDKMAKIEKESAKMKDYFNSLEWKKQIVNIEKESSKVNAYFTSPEWKKQVENIRNQSAHVSKYFESEDWKRQIANIEKESAKLKEHFNSAEWKADIRKMQEDGKKIQEYFNSPEWKEKSRQWKELQDSEEYKEIDRKYQKELKELKSKKGLTGI